MNNNSLYGSKKIKDCYQVIKIFGMEVNQKLEIKIAKEEIVEVLKQLSLSDMNYVLDHLKSIAHDKFYATYRVVNVYSGQVNISDRIFKETGFQCYHEPSDLSAGRGTNVICIPHEKYSKELEKELLNKYSEE